MRPHRVPLANGWRVTWCPRRKELLLARGVDTPDLVAVPIGVLAEWELTWPVIRAAMILWRDTHKLPEGTAQQRKCRRQRERPHDRKRKRQAALAKLSQPEPLADVERIA